MSLSLSRMESEPHYYSLFNTLIQGKQKELDDSYFGKLHRTFWKPSDTSEKPPSELNTWLNAGRAHFKAQLSPDAAITDEGYHPPMIRTELEGNMSGQRIQCRVREYNPIISSIGRQAMSLATTSSF